MWTCTQLLSAKYCNLLRKTKLQNAYSPHIPHSGKKKKKPAACQSWTSLHVLSWTQSTNPEGTWVTNGDHGETTRDHVIPSSAHRTHWLQFYKVKMPKKKKMWRRCPQSFLSREGSSKQQATASGYWEWSLRLSVIGYYGSLAFGDVRESVYRVFQPLSLNNDFVILRSLWVLIPFPTPSSNSPWGCLFLIYI